MLGKHFPGIGSCWLVLRDLGTGPGFTDGEAETRLYRVSVFWVSVKCLMFATGEIFFFFYVAGSKVSIWQFKEPLSEATFGVSK